MRGLTAPARGRAAGTRTPSPNDGRRRAMRILRPPSLARPTGPGGLLITAGAGAGPLPCRVRLADGRVFTGALPAARHRSTPARAAARRHGGARRAHARHAPRRRAARASTAAATASTSCPAAPAATRGWLRALLAHAERIVAGTYASARPGERPGEEVFVGVAPRDAAARRASDAVADTRWLWVDVDRPDRLDALWAFLAERPVPPADRLRRLRRRARLLAARRAAARPPGPARRRRDRADRARPRPDHPRARRRRATAGPTSPTRAAPSARA